MIVNSKINIFKGLNMDEIDDCTSPPNPLPKKSEGKVSAAYVITHIDTGLFYVGSSGDVLRRAQNHKSTLELGNHKAHRLQEAYCSGDELAIEIFKTESREEAYDIEQKFLDETHGNPASCNFSKDARAAYKGMPRVHSTETKEKMAASHSGKTLSDEHKENIRLSNLGKNLGKKRTPEQIERIREISTGRVMSVETRQKMSQSSTGRTHSDESKEKMRAAVLGRKASDETKQRMSESRIGKFPSEETKAKMREARKKNAVELIIDGKIYGSAVEASHELSVNVNTVRNRVISDSPTFVSWKYLNK